MATSSSTAGGQHHASLNLMACVRESSPQQDDLVSDTTDADLIRNGKCYTKTLRANTGLRIHVFWDVILCLWVRRFEAT
jgi:hypothetical protein